jgi:hypothetical protein
MKPRKVKNVRVPNRALLSSEQSSRKKSHGGSPKGDASMHEGANNAVDESTNDAASKSGPGNHRSGHNNR